VTKRFCGILAFFVRRFGPREAKIATGKAQILVPRRNQLLEEILVTDLTNHRLGSIIEKAAAAITNKGGRTSHAAIVHG
jgi:phosphoenolpyruvate synthase/pyruvate phosphate dikinase